MWWDPLQLLYWKWYEWWNWEIVPPERGVIALPSTYSLVTFAKPSKWTQYATMWHPATLVHTNNRQGRLFLGSSLNAMRPSRSYSLVINATLEVPSFHSPNAQFWRIPIRDVHQASLFLNEGHGLYIVLALHQALLRGEQVLIHCFAGASRSVSIVLAYLMWLQRSRSMVSIYEELRRRRQIVHVNTSFLQDIQYMLPLWDQHTHQLGTYLAA
tara:strand:- start:1004 stop:1642 length:639 start_codon:yes stop_codon:yes gene_type:complete